MGIFGSETAHVVISDPSTKLLFVVDTDLSTQESCRKDPETNHKTAEGKGWSRTTDAVGFWRNGRLLLFPLPQGSLLDELPWRVFLKFRVL